MASIRDLKKDINFVLGDIIEAVQIKELENPELDGKKGDAIVEEAIAIFDELMEQVNQKGVENAKTHFKSIRATLEKKAGALVAKVNKL